MHKNNAHNMSVVRKVGCNSNEEGCNRQLCTYVRMLKKINF